MNLGRRILLVGTITTIALLLFAIALGQSAQAASGITVHNNTGSDHTVRAYDYTGRLHYIEPGTTDSMGARATIVVAANTCIRHGVPGTTEAQVKCATRTASTSWILGRSEWLDVRPL